MQTIKPLFLEQRLYCCKAQDIVRSVLPAAYLYEKKDAVELRLYETFVDYYLRDLDENNNQGEQHQGLDEGQSQDQCQLNAWAGGRIAGQSFTGGGSHA